MKNPQQYLENETRRLIHFFKDGKLIKLINLEKLVLLNCFNMKR